MIVNSLKMLTQKEVAELLNTTKDNVSMLRRIGILPAIKTGRNYMFSQDVIRRFQEDYEGLDVSNLQEALASKHELEMKRGTHINDTLGQLDDANITSSGIRCYP